MNNLIQQFLAHNAISVLTVLLKDGTPHAATVHFSHTEEPLRFFIQTRANSMKCEALSDTKPSPAAFVVGFNEKEMITVQAHGTVRIVTEPSELEALCKVHYAKHPFAEKFRDEGTAFLEFTPTWWRYTDMSNRPPKIITNE